MPVMRYQPSGTGGASPSGVYTHQPYPFRPERRKGKVTGHRVITSGLSGGGGPGIVVVGDGNPLGNPNFSCIAGPELLPSISTTVPVDVGTGYVFQHFLGPTGIDSFVNRATAEFIDFKDIQQHFVGFDLYRNVQSINDYTPPVQVVLPLRSVAAGAGVILSGAATALECLANAGDNKFVELDSAVPNNTITLAFDPAELETNWTTGRISKMSLRYVAWRDDDSEPVPGEGFKVEIVDTTLPDSEELGSWLIQNYRRYAVYEQKELGETNPIPRGKTAWPSYDLHPFTVEDLIAMNAATNRMFLRITPLAGDLTQTTVFFDYVELIVEVIPEYRTAVAIRNVSNASAAVAANTGIWSNSVEWRYPYSSGLLVILSITDDLFMVVRETRPADPSDYYRAKTTGVQTVAPMEAFGPALEIMGVLQHRSADEFVVQGVKQIQTFRGAIADGQIAEGSLESFLDFRLSTAHFNPGTVATAGAFWASYRAEIGYELQKSYTGQSPTQRIWLEGGVSYAWVRVLAQPSPQANGDIEFQIYNSAGVLLTQTFQYTPEDWRADFPSNSIYGWSEVLLETDDVITPLVSDWYYIAATSNAGANQPWLIAGAEPTGMQPYFSYDVVPDGFGSGDERIVDFAMTFDCDGTEIQEPTVTVGANDLDTVSCGVTEAPIVEIEWTSDGNWDQYVLQIRTFNYNYGDGFTFHSISKAITALPAGQVHTYVFQSPAWDARSAYYVVGHRATDLLEVRSDPSLDVIIPSQGAVLGIGQLGVEDGINAIYAPVSNGASVEIAWQNMTVVEPIALHGQDNYSPLVPVELRGLSFSVTVLVDYLGICSTPDDESMEGLTTGQQSMDRKSWATLVELADYGKVWVQFPGGRVDSYIMQLGSMSASTEHGVYAAELNFTKLSGINLGLLGDDE